MLSFDLVHVQPQLFSSQESERLLSSREPIHEIYVESEDPKYQEVCYTPVKAEVL